MELTRRYERVRFPVGCLQEAEKVITSLRDGVMDAEFPNDDWRTQIPDLLTPAGATRVLRVRGDQLTYDTDSEFFEDYRQAPSSYTFGKSVARVAAVDDQREFRFHRRAVGRADSR